VLVKLDTLAVYILKKVKARKMFRKMSTKIISKASRDYKYLSSCMFV